jgi:hypothetical protein
MQIMSEEQKSPEKTTPDPVPKLPKAPESQRPPESRPKEIGGAKGPEPTRYGDWEQNGRCTDF